MFGLIVAVVVVGLGLSVKVIGALRAAQYKPVTLR